MFTILGADGKEYGPVPADKVQAWIKARRANLQTKARRDGEAEWKTLGDFAEFATAPAPAAGDAPLPPITVASMIGTPAAAAPATELELGGRGVRLLAQIIDFLTSCLVMLPGGALLLMGGGSRSGVISLAGMGLIGLGVVILFVIQIYLLTTCGQTIGKKLMNVRIVVFDDETNPGFVKAFLLRVFVNGLIGAVPFLGYIYFLVDICFIFRDDRRCIHDLLAGTKVVKA